MNPIAFYFVVVGYWMTYGVLAGFSQVLALSWLAGGVLILTARFVRNEWWHRQ